MFHDLARIVLLCPNQAAKRDQSNEPGSPVTLQAFAILRFEREDERNMIYWYVLIERIVFRN